MSSAARGAIRSMKNVAKGYSDIQIKVREATSNDTWGPPTDLMRQIAVATHNDVEFVEIMIIVEKRLNDNGRQWRHVYKALVLLEYLILCGSDRVLQYARDNLYIVKTLKEFQYTDESGADQGHNVRQRAKAITELISNDELLARERSTRRDLADRVGSSHDTGYGGPSYSGPNYGGGSLNRSRNASIEFAADEEEQMRRAIQESLRSAELEKQRRGGRSTTPATRPPPTAAASSSLAPENMSEEEQLQRAIELSKREEEERQRRRGGGGGGGAGSSSSTPGGGKAQLIDLFGGDEQPIAGQQQMPLATGVVDPFGMPSQNPFTAQQTGYTAVSSQPTGGFDPFGQPIQPTPTGFMNALPTGNPFQMQQQAQPTGNPFAPQPTGAFAPQPTGGFAPQQTGLAMPAPTAPNMNPFASTGGSMTPTPMAATGVAGPQRPSSTPARPMVDLDNIGAPNTRNPFAMTSTHSTGGSFNWSGEDSGAKKMSLAELAAAKQQQGLGGLGAIPTPATGFGGGGGGMGVAQTGPAGMGGMHPNPFGMQPTGAAFAMPQQHQTGVPFGQQQQQQTGNNPFQF